MNPDAASDAFWRWSLAFYGDPTVRGACLRLQDEASCNVNLLLFAHWLGARSWTIGESGAEVTRSAIAGWHGCVVEGLRAVRRRLKEEDEPALYERTLALEIECERIEQKRLVHAAVPHLGPSPDLEAAATAGLDTLDETLRLLVPAARAKPELLAILRYKLIAIATRNTSD